MALPKRQDTPEVLNISVGAAMGETRNLDQPPATNPGTADSERLDKNVAEGQVQSIAL